jgi:hypothetical protein
MAGLYPSILLTQRAVGHPDQFAQRRFTLSSDEEARVAECADVATLHRWHDQAITAGTAAEALQ